MVALTKKIILAALLASLVIGQASPVFAQIEDTTDLSMISISVPTATMGDIPRMKDKIWVQVMRGVSYAVVEAFTSRFINKLVDKYKVRNYLYYDQVLTDYYLNRYLADKISDPDLQNIYQLMYRGYVTGDSTGTTGGPNPASAVVPRLKRAISSYYIKQGGIDPNYIANPPANANAFVYYSASYAYNLSPMGFTEQNLKGQFGSFQSEATTASQLEIIVGNGLKAGRFVGGTCSISFNFEKTKPDNLLVRLGLVKQALAQSDPPVTPGPPPVDTLPGTQIPIEQPPFDPNGSPAACQAAGGTWQQSALDQARSFIDNPSFVINNWLQGVISSKSNSNFDPSNFWFAIGSSLGRFLSNQLLLNKSYGTLPEDPRPYIPLNDNAGSGAGVGYDVDDDQIVDGYDYDGDGQMDVCVYGGEAPNCTGSSFVINPMPPSDQQCQGESLQLPKQHEAAVQSAIEQALSDYPALADSTDKNPADAEILVRAAVGNLINAGYRAGTAINCNGVSHPEQALIAGLPGEIYGEYYRAWREFPVAPEDSGYTFRQFYERYFMYIEHANWERAE